MLRWHQPETIEGYTTYHDDSLPNVLYLMPKQPTFRVDEKGRPIFKFLKYREPIERVDTGKKGGGFLIFDVELTIPQVDQDKVKAKFQEHLNASVTAGTKAPTAQIGTIP